MCVQKMACEHFGTSKFLIAIGKQAVVDFHLISHLGTVIESSRLEKELRDH